VDDSARDADNALRALSPAYEARAFSDGTALIEQLDQRPPPNAIVLDWVMPAMSGIEVCRFLRAQPGRVGRIPILLLTVNQRTEEIVDGLSSGANDFLSKPYQPPELRARVAALLRTHQFLERAESAEENVRTFLDSSPDALIGVGPDGRVSYVNDASTSVFAQARDRLLGRRLTELLPSLSPESLASTVVPSAPASFPDIEIEGQLYAPTSSTLSSSLGQRTIIALRNVTDRRRAEMRRLDFYSMVAHDLRSPLNAIVLLTSRIRRGRLGELPPGLLDEVQKIEDNARSQMALLSDFLDLARLEGTAYVFDRSVVDLRDIVDRAVAQLRPMADASGLTLEVILPPEPASVLGDPRRLIQVLDNLVGNAIKYTPAGGGVVVQISIGDQQVETVVHDTGHGIAAQDLPTLFDRFTRASSTAHMIGTGLGLMIVREVVQAHGGVVGVESTPGRGSRFWFRLPSAPAPPPDPKS
jgi:two-component system phosphate regulon sensor histidine kinase PhoR